MKIKLKPNSWFILQGKNVFKQRKRFFLCTLRYKPKVLLKEYRKTGDEIFNLFPAK